MLIAVVMFFVLKKMPAPFGRFSNVRWGKMISNRIGWSIMEIPALVVFPLVLFLGRGLELFSHLSLLIFVGFWIVHYFHRGVVYPWRLSRSRHPIAIAVVCMALVYNGINGILLGYHFGFIYTIPEPTTWVIVRMAVGAAIFITGMGINNHHDTALIRLGKTGDGGYQIPRVGLFNHISAPNLLGEIIEWIGFAVLCATLPALSMAVWTMANLIPRAIQIHAWYIEEFPDYPDQRRALVPAFGHKGT